VIQVALIDPKVYLPVFLLNWLIVNVAYLILPMLSRQTKCYAPGGKFHDRVLGKPEIYDEIRKRLRVLQDAIIRPQHHLVAPLMPHAAVAPMTRSDSKKGGFSLSNVVGRISVSAFTAFLLALVLIFISYREQLKSPETRIFNYVSGLMQRWR
jgi:hypothetical protein